VKWTPEAAVTSTKFPGTGLEFEEEFGAVWLKLALVAIANSSTFMRLGVWRNLARRVFIAM